LHKTIDRELSIYEKQWQSNVKKFIDKKLFKDAIELHDNMKIQIKGIEN